MIGSEKEYSLYFHVPFCSHKCPYCNFYVIPDKEHFKTQYFRAIKKEWELKKHLLSPTSKLVSVYFGGGTPSLLQAKEIDQILSFLPIHSNLEITLEANPESFTIEKAKNFYSVGINRISLGVQTFDSKELQILQRSHTNKEAVKAVFRAQEAGFNNISIDLMYDLPGQTLLSWENSLCQALQLPISHISLYNLTIEPHTVFFKRRSEIAPQMPNEQLSLSLLEKGIDKANQSGFNRYEISAFAKEGFFSRHNIGYWTARPFLGFGPSAFSYIGQRRFQTTPNFLRWIKKVEKGEDPTEFEEKLNKTQKLKELFILHLRLLQGFSYQEFIKKFGKLSQKSEKLLTQWEQEKLLEIKEEKIFLTVKGALFYDTLATQFI